MVKLFKDGKPVSVFKDAWSALRYIGLNVTIVEARQKGFHIKYIKELA